MNDLKKIRIKNDKVKILDFPKSAQNRSRMPQLPDSRRIKSSVSQKELIDGLSQDSREDSFILQYQKQLLPRNSFSGDHKLDKISVQPVIFHRSVEDKMKNPDRITLDRQNMTFCPILENEDNLRLLNYQYNQICRIEHLDKLRRLILLDLYDNRIEKISGLDNLKCLRVLMLGRNRISEIDGLQALTRLDVLDLHANCVQRIENLNHLSELRVLNLAGNNIQSLDNLHGLMSLTEINIRRNCIETVVDLTSFNCPNLQRLYLSFNHISRIADLSCLVELTSLNDLSLDNNPICRHNHTRPCLIHTFSQLQQLDSKTITDDERYRAKQIVNRLDSATKTHSTLSRNLLLSNGKVQCNDAQVTNVQRFNSMKERRKSSVSNSRRTEDSWTNSGKSVSPRLSIKCLSGHNKSDSVSSSLYVTDTSNNNVNVSDSDRETFGRSIRKNSYSQELINNQEFYAIQETLVKPPQSSHTLIQSSQKLLTMRPSSASSITSKTDSSKSFINSETCELSSTTVTSNDVPQLESKPPEISSLEVVVELDQIVFYSTSSLKVFDDKEFWFSKVGLSTTITTLIFRDTDFSVIEKVFTSIKTRLPNFKKASFYSCNLHCYSQINSLANLKRLEELFIDKTDNPLASFTFIRFYVAFRLAHLGLRKFNDLEITESEFLAGRRYFIPLAIIGPGQVLQLHLIGVINDTKRRELLHSSNDAMTSMTMYNCSSSQTPSVTLDLVGKSGLLSSNTLSEYCNSLDEILSSLCIESVMKEVDRKCNLENNFHNQWVSVLWRMVLSRMEPLLDNRTEFMKQQYEEIVSKANVTKISSVRK